jgi:plasmid stabilization system protein ParE
VNITLAPEAEQDLTKSALYYAREAGPDIGRAFITEFERSVALLADHPTLGAPWRGDIRRLPMRRFPYSIVYRLGASEIEVFAIAHQRRRPGYWKR